MFSDDLFDELGVIDLSDLNPTDDPEEISKAIGDKVDSSIKELKEALEEKIASSVHRQFTQKRESMAIDSCLWRLSLVYLASEVDGTLRKTDITKDYYVFFIPDKTGRVVIEGRINRPLEDFIECTDFTLYPEPDGDDYRLKIFSPMSGGYALKYTPDNGVEAIYPTEFMDKLDLIAEDLLAWYLEKDSSSSGPFDFGEILDSFMSLSEGSQSSNDMGDRWVKITIEDDSDDSDSHEITGSIETDFEYGDILDMYDLLED